MSAPEEFTAELAADPATPAEVLAQIAQYRPDLLVALASNPSLYPALRAWLATSSDPRVHQALAWSAQTPTVAPVPPVPQIQVSPVTPQASGASQVPPPHPPVGGTEQ